MEHTPRTDHVLSAIKNRDEKNDSSAVRIVLVDLCRTLEKELYIALKNKG